MNPLRRGMPAGGSIGDFSGWGMRRGHLCERLAGEARARLRVATEQLFGEPTVSDYLNTSEEGR